MRSKSRLTLRGVIFGAIGCVVFPLLLCSTWWAGDAPAKERVHVSP